MFMKLMFAEKTQKMKRELRTFGHQFFTYLWHFLWTLEHVSQNKTVVDFGWRGDLMYHKTLGLLYDYDFPVSFSPAMTVEIMIFVKINIFTSSYTS